MVNNFKVIVAAGAIFCLGYAICHLVESREVNNQAGILHHWEKLEEYHRQFDEPTNQRVINGMIAVDVDIDPLPTLAALVSANEILHVDLVFPNVPASRRANTYWMNFVNENEDILYVEGNPEYIEFPTSGSQLLHLNLWFRKSAVAQVQELIRQLESREK